LFGLVELADMRMRYGKRFTLRRASRFWKHEVCVGLCAGFLAGVALSLVVLCGK